MKTMKDHQITDEEANMLNHDPIGVEVNLLYELSWAMDILLEDIESRMKAKKFSFIQDKKRAFNQFNNYVRLAKTHFDNFQDQDCINRIFVYKDGNMSDYDRMRSDANTLLRLLCTFVEKCSQKQENEVKVFNYLKKFKGVGLLKDSDIERFRLG